MNKPSLFLHRLSYLSRVSRNKSSTSLPEETSRLVDIPPSPSSAFQRAKLGSFLQAAPQHENAYLSDAFLQSYLKRVLPKDVMDDIEPDLIQFGERVATDIWALGQECEVNQPYLRQFDAWGNRIDDIVTCEAWKEQKRISAREGLIAIPYERSQGEFSRLYQVAKLYMYSTSSGLYGCPLAMTDGAAKTIESQKLDLPEAWSHLTSRHPEKFWTSGQWMTERRGGSDVGSGTETIAVRQDEDNYLLYGYKWFSSATDSDMSLTLARIADSGGNITPGSRGLSMFYLKTRQEDGSLNNIQVVKMKNKLGTRQLPTAELLLDGVSARLVSSPGRGVASIAGMLTITRIHNTVTSVAAMRKIVSLARDYATRREAFGGLIQGHPLHLQTLARMEVETRGCCALMMELGRQLGLDDAGMLGDEDGLLLRLMLPVAKMYTGKMAVAVVSEGLECFGGQGYIEDTGLPGILRDAQVLPIWEGTSSVMALDVARAVSKTKGEALVAFYSRVTGIVGKGQNIEAMKSSCDSLSSALEGTMALLNKNPRVLEFAGRDFAFSLAHIYIGALLMEHAALSEQALDCEIVARWCQRDLSPVMKDPERYSQEQSSTDQLLVYQNYDTNNVFSNKHKR